MSREGFELAQLGVKLGSRSDREWTGCVVTDEVREKLETSKRYALELIPDDEWDVAKDRYRFAVVDAAQTLHGEATGQHCLHAAPRSHDSALVADVARPRGVERESRRIRRRCAQDGARSAFDDSHRGAAGPSDRRPAGAPT